MVEVTVKGGFVRSITFDQNFLIRRRVEWLGPILLSPRPDDDLFRKPPDDDGIELGLPRLPPEPETDRDLLGGGPIELTPRGPRQPSKPADDVPAPKPDEGETKPPAKPIKLDPWAHLPPPFPPPYWRPDILLPSPRPEPLPDHYSFWDPCDIFHPFGPFGPFVEPLDHIELIFPRIPGLGPYQSPLEEAVAEGLREFFKEVGKAADAGTIHGEDWEKAGRAAGQKAGKVLWDYIRSKLEERFFDGELSLETACEFAEQRPWLTGIGIFLGLTGYGLYLGNEYDRKGKLKLDFGDFQFEYDGETREWSAGFRFKFKF